MEKEEKKKFKKIIKKPDKLPKMLRDEKGKFIKGHPGTKPKGSVNKTVAEMKERLQNMINSYEEDQMIADFKKLRPAEKLRIMNELLEYLIPKLNKSDFNINTEKDEIIIMLPE
ncbi:MAG: hypothetical protein WCO13_12615 [Bacteroidota bacterium]